MQHHGVAVLPFWKSEISGISIAMFSYQRAINFNQNQQEQSIRGTSSFCYFI